MQNFMKKIVFGAQFLTPVWGSLETTGLPENGIKFEGKLDGMDDRDPGRQEKSSGLAGSEPGVQESQIEGSSGKSENLRNSDKKFSPRPGNVPNPPKMGMEIQGNVSRGWVIQAPPRA